jgi:ribosomal protein S18 acetylase RimI-like enzyme
MATQKRSTKRKPLKRKTPKPAQKKQAGEPINQADVVLVKGKGSKERGGGLGGAYWHIHLGEKRVGFVYINIIDEAPFGQHASLQIKVNLQYQGRHIGRTAYRQACEQSGHNEVIIHMRKSNTASRRAAEAAGFEVVEDTSIPQLAMIWRRESKL